MIYLQVHTNKHIQCGEICRESNIARFESHGGYWWSPIWLLSLFWPPAPHTIKLFASGSNWTTTCQLYRRWHIYVRHLLPAGVDIIFARHLCKYLLEIKSQHKPGWVVCLRLSLAPSQVGPIRKAGVLKIWQRQRKAVEGQSHSPIWRLRHLADFT